MVVGPGVVQRGHFVGALAELPVVVVIPGVGLRGRGGTGILLKISSYSSRATMVGFITCAPGPIKLLVWNLFHVGVHPVCSPHQPRPQHLHFQFVGELMFIVGEGPHSSPKCRPLHEIPLLSSGTQVQLIIVDRGVQHAVREGRVAKKLPPSNHRSAKPSIRQHAIEPRRDPMWSFAVLQQHIELPALR